MIVEFHPAASAEFDYYTDRYEGAVPDLGWRFIREVEGASDLISNYLEIGQEIEYGSRFEFQALARKNPLTAFRRTLTAVGWCLVFPKDSRRATRPPVRRPRVRQLKLPNERVQCWRLDTYDI